MSTQKISDPANVKENYNSYLKRKNAKLLKRPKIITQRLKAIENSNIVDIKSVIVWTFKYFTWIIQDYNTSWKESPSTHLQKIVIVLYIVKQKTLKYFAWKTVKATKRSHGFKGYAKSYNVEILGVFLILNFNLKILNLQSKIS